MAFLVVLAFSCSKDDLMKTDQDNDRYADVQMKGTGPVFEVTDEGDDDTEALLEAFALAQDAGKGAVVKLMPGTFEIGMIEVKEFFGTLTGSGKGTSTITNLPDLLPDEVIAANMLPALITFIGGDVTVSNLSVQLSEGLSWLGTTDMNMLLFSDYSADFMPVKKHIGVNLKNIEVTGLLIPDVEIWPGGPIIDVPYNNFNGVMLAPDRQPDINPIPRSNIDVSVSNSSFTNFLRGIYVHGCKSGNLSFGETGGNIFTQNNQGLVVNENIGVNVKILNNEFTIPDYYWEGIDLNTGEAVFGFQQFDDANKHPGIYEIRNNILNIHYSNGMGIMDAWRYVHPENPSWMIMIWDNNTFNALVDGAWMGLTFNLKNALFLNNTIVGDASDGFLANYGIYWIDPSDPNYLLSCSEGCKFLDNKFLQENYSFYLHNDVKNWLVMGDLSNLIIDDQGINNRFIGKTNPGHANTKSTMDRMNRIERLRNMYKK